MDRLYRSQEVEYLTTFLHISEIDVGGSLAMIAARNPIMIGSLVLLTIVLFVVIILWVILKKKKRHSYTPSAGKKTHLKRSNNWVSNPQK